MIISHKYKFIFVHVPKSAGTSIRSRLLELDPQSESHWGEEWATHLHRRVDRAHEPLEDLLQRREMHRLLRKYFVFAFVRNPYDRFMSAVSEFRRRTPIDPRAQTLSALLASLTPDGLRNDLSLIHFCPMHYFTHVGNKRWVDEIYDFDNLEAGLVRLSQSIGISARNFFPLPEMNVSRDALTPPETHLSLNELATLSDLYERDFALFGYNRVSDPAHSSNAHKQATTPHPFREFMAKPAHFDSISALLSDIKNIDDQRRRLLDERYRLYNHVFFGPMLKFWRRFINPALPIDPQ